MALLKVNDDGTIGVNTQKKKKRQGDLVVGSDGKITFNADNIRTRLAEKEEEEDIAPVRTDTKRSWFNSGLFEDGYDFGDISKTILGTNKDLADDLASGVAGIGEGLIDTGAYIAGGAAKLLGADDLSEKMKKFQERDLIKEYGVADKLVDKLSPGGNLLGLANDFVNKGNTEKISVLGDKTDSLMQSAGQLAGTAGLQMVGVPWWLTTGVTSFGYGTEQAFQNDATYGEAGAYGLISAGAEVLTEKLSGGIKFGGKTLDEGLKRKLTEGITNKTVNTLAKLGFDMAGEGAEEVLSEVVTNIGEKLTFADEKTWNEVLTSEEAVEGYIESFVGGAVLGGGFSAGKAYKSAKTGRDYDTGLTDNEQLVVNAEITNRTIEIQKQRAVKQQIDRIIEEREKTFGTLNDTEKRNIKKQIQERLDNGELDYSTAELSKKELKEIESQVLEDLKYGNVSIDTIEDALVGDKTAHLKELEQTLTNTTDEAKKAEIKAEINQIKLDKATQLKDLLGKDVILQESYRQESLKKQEFDREVAETDSDITKELLESAKASKMNNTRKMHNLFEYTNKIANDTGTKYGFVNNDQLKELGYDVEGKTVNGLVRVSEGGSAKVLINVDSDKALNTIIGHETTHLLEGTNEYKALQDIVKEYATTKGEYDSRFKEISKLYEGTNANVESEVTADLVGDYLFTDEQFINNLSAKQPNVFQRVYDYIKHVYKMATAGSKEARQLEQVKRRFDKAYKEMSKTTTSKVDSNLTTEADSDIKYSFAGVNSNTADISLKDRAVEMRNQGVSPEQIWKETGWKYGNDHKWRYEIDDSKAVVRPSGDADLLSDPDYKRMNELFQKFMSARMTKEEANEYNALSKKFEGRKTKVLSNILSHDSLYAAYPQLKNIGIEVMKYGPDVPRAAYYKNLNTIEVREDVYRRAEELKGTILHEVQHAIQNIEGFERGGNDNKALVAVRKEFADFVSKYAPDRVKEAVDKDTAEGRSKHTKALVDEFIKKYYNLDKIDDDVKYEFYRNLMGEREARAVTARANLSDSERRGIYPNYDEGAFRQEPYNDGGRLGLSDNMGVYEFENGPVRNMHSGADGTNHSNFRRFVQSSTELETRRNRNGQYLDIGETKVPNEGAFFDAEKTQFSLSASTENRIPVKGYAVYGSDIKLQEDIAPVKETISKPETVAKNATTEDIAPIPEDAAPVEKEAEAEQETEEAPLIAKTRKEIRKALLEDDQDIIIRAMENAKNLSSPLMNNTDTIRLSEMVFGRAAGKKINDLIFQKVLDNEAKSVSWQNEQRKAIKDLGIKARSKESAAVQKWGEGEYVNQFGDVIEYTDSDLILEFPDVETQKKIKNAAIEIRKRYDEYIDVSNQVLTGLGFKPIEKRKNYFMHFQELGDFFSKNGIPFNPQSMAENNLPTDINGLTEFFVPQKKYFASMNRREGKRTVYDAITGIDKYISGVADLIYHTEDIQRGRAFEELIRDTYGQNDTANATRDALPEELRFERLEKQQTAHLSKYVRWLHNWTDGLAGKKNRIDRAIEDFGDRAGFSVLDTARKQVSANMIGFNPASALTNVIASVQAISKTDKVAVAKGTADTIRNIIQKDDFVSKNSFLINRFGTDMLSKNKWQQIQDAGFVFMKGMDWFSSNQIVRSKFYELKAQGMTDTEAHAEAGKFAARIMGDRTKGANAMFYNSKLFNVIGQFQLEVNNQLYSIFYDTYQESKEKANENALKTAAGMTFTLGQMFAFTHLFGKTFESVAGYNPTFDVFGIIATALGLGDDEEDDVVDNLQEAAEQLLKALPYSSLFTDGGRIPLSSGIPNIPGLITGAKDSYGNELDFGKEMAKLPYLLLPAGYGQIKKTSQGLGMFDDDLPVTGSYTDSGNLRFPVEATPLNVLQAGVFGQWSSENARNYFNNERKPLGEKQIQEYKDLDIPIADYWKYREDLKGKKKLEDKFDYIADLDLPVSKKNIMINNIVDRKEAADKTNYDQFGSYEEFDWAYENPEKYSYLESIGVSYKQYSASKESKEAYNWAYNNPEKYSLAKAAAGDVVKYRSYTSDLNDITADKDSSGKSISGSRKTKVANYINGLDADYGSKLILFKSEYPADDTYNYEIIEYLNNRQDISYAEMVSILTELDFTVDANGNVTW